MAENWTALYTVSLIILGALILLCALRAVLGPRAGDRLLSVNMITTLVTICICILARMLGEAYLADAALIFSLLGWLAAVTLTRIMPERKSKMNEPLSADRKGGTRK